MRRLLWIITAISAGVYICGPIQDPDLWWHITAGRWILSHGMVPVADHWTRFSSGELWRAYSWLIEILFAFLDGRFGIVGLLAAKLLLSAAIGIAFSYALSKIADDWFFGLFLGIFTTTACFNHFTLRPQSFVWIYFMAVILLAEAAARGGMSWQRRISIFLLFVLWSNTHLSAVLGLVVLGSWLMWNRDIEAVERGWGQYRAALFSIAAGFFGTLVTPYFGGEWAAMTTHAAHPALFRGINEFQAGTILQYSTGFLILGLVFLTVFLHRAPGVLENGKLAAGALFLGASLAVVKFLPFAVIYLSALTANAWRRCKTRPGVLGPMSEGIERLRALVEKIPREGLSFLFICTIIVNIHSVWISPISTEVVAVHPMDFIIEQKLPHPILNAFGEGGYVMYRLSDKNGKLDYPVSIDGRTNLIPPDLWEKFSAAMSGKITWREYVTLVNPKTILWRTESPLTAILEATKEWCLAFREGSAKKGYSVFIERNYYESMKEKIPSVKCG